MRPSKPLGHLRERRERQHAGLCRGERQSGRGLDRSASRASASTRPASTAISTRCCKTSCGRKLPAAPTPIRRPSSTSSSSRSTERPARRPRSTGSTTISPPRCKRCRAIRVRIRRRTQVVGAAQALTQNLNSMTGNHPAIAHAGRAGHRHRRADRQHRDPTDRADQPAARARRRRTARPRRSKTSATRTSPSSPS